MSYPDVVNYFALGMSVWFLTWGSNRVYLTLKKFLT